MLRFQALFLLCCWTILAGCSDGSSGTTDPRCTALCVITEPSIAGAYDICSVASADLCKQQCALRLVGVTSLCGTCLLEKASFGQGSSSSPSFCKSDPTSGCANGICEASAGGTTCSWCQGEQQKFEACMRQIYPRKETSCSTRFRPVDECQAICAGSTLPRTDGGGGTATRKDLAVLFPDGSTAGM